MRPGRPIRQPGEPQVTTSIRDLLAAANAEQRSADRAQATDAALAGIAAAARLLMQLSADGLDREAGSPRELLTRELATACHAATTLRGGPDTPRSGQLIAAAADAAALLRHTMTTADRWAITLETASVIRRSCAVVQRCGPELELRPLAHIRTLAVRLAQLGAQEPPDPYRVRAIDHLVPESAGRTVGGPAALAAEAAAGLTVWTRRAELARQPLPLYHAKALCLANESAAAFGAAAAIALGAQDADDLKLAAHAWARAYDTISALTDGLRTGDAADDDALALCARLNGGLRRALLDPDRVRAAQLDPQTLPHVQIVINQMPRHADAIKTSLNRSHGRVLMAAKNLPIDESTIGRRLRGGTVVAGGRDFLEPVVALKAAAILSTKLAVILAQAHPAPQPQPAWTSAYNAQHHSERDWAVVRRIARMAELHHQPAAGIPHWNNTPGR
jgi:hypothetical protein